MRYLLCAVALIASSASAQSPVALSSKVMVERAETVDGQRRMTVKPATSVVPGETIVITISYRNGGAKPVTNFVVSNPVPASAAFAGQASPGAQVSVDGGKHWGALATLRVSGPAGDRPAQEPDVTAVRWVLASVPPGTSGSVSFKGMVR